MRILYHHRTQAEDGQAVHIRALQRAFEQEGHELREVSFVARQANPKSAGRSRGGGWQWFSHLPKVARETAEYGYTAVARQRLISAAAEFRPHFIYERYAFGNAGGVVAARHLGIPLVLEVNSPMVVELLATRGLALPAFARRIENFVFRSADVVCAVTAVLREMLIGQGVVPERILVTPNGVDLELYGVALSGEPLRTNERLRARADLGLREGPHLVLGFVGYYRTWHRLELAIEALRQPFLADAELVLIGEGPARAELEARARALGVERRVRFAGARSHGEIPRLLAALDIALVPAINPYASPLKLHEYMAAGIAVVGPDQPNVREVLIDGQNALLFPPGDADALARALAALAGDVSLRQRLGKAARSTVIERDLTWRSNARRVAVAVGPRLESSL